MKSKPSVKSTTKRAWTEGRRKVMREGECRVCGSYYALDPHHIAYRSLGGDNDEKNCAPVCRTCHRAIHDKQIDLGDYLNQIERAHVCELLGEGVYRDLLWPSKSSKRVESVGERG